MGRLKQLELENFKSYSGNQVVGPFDDFTCIIGPNGAGKSNMMDAISFVLGVQSRHLRSSQLKELIFRKDMSSPPARRASVKLVYEVSEGEVPGYRGGQELVFSRTISSTGVSTYRLDDKEMTYETYDAFLQRIGVLVKARNFLVFQGDVESVASKSPQELTKLLEHICGSDLHRAEYEDLMRQKAEAEEKTIFTMQKKKMFANQRKEVKDQKDEAEEFQGKVDQLNQMKTEHILWKIFGLKVAIEEHQKASEKFGKILESAKEKEFAVEEEIAESKRELARVNKVLTAVEKDYATKTKQLTSITPKLMETRDKLKRLRKRIEELQSGEGNLKKDLEEQIGNIAGLRSDMAALEKAERDLKAEQDAADGSLVQLDETELEEYARLREELTVRTVTEHAEQLSIEQEATSKRQRIQRLELQDETLRVDMDAADKLIAEHELRIHKLETAMSESEKEKNDILSGREKLNEEIKLCQQRATNLSIEMDEVVAKLSEVGDERRRGKQEEKMSEAVETMKRIFTGVHGKLIDLCRPIQKKYSQAVTVTAGKHMDAIVVDTKQTASDCIRYLKDQRIGTCAILPLDNLQVKPIPDRLRALGSGYKLCIDLVECDELFKPAVSYALGSTIICDTLRDAQDLCFHRNEKVKAVTLSGHVIGKSGAMTGGSTSKDTHDRWEEKDVEKLRKKKHLLEESVAENKRSMPSRQHIVDLETKLKTLQTKIQFSEADKRVTEEKMQQLRQQRQLKTKNSQDLKKESATLSKELAALDKRLSSIQEVIRKAEIDIFGSFSKNVGVANIREYEESRLRLHNDRKQKFSAICEQKASLAAQLEYELKRDFKGSLGRIKAQIDEGAADLKTLDEEEKSLIAQEEQIRLHAKAAEKKVSEASTQRDDENKKAKLLQSKRSTAVVEREAISKKLSGEDILIERARAQIHEVLQKAEVDEIYLPTVPSKDEDDTDRDLQWSGNLGGSDDISPTDGSSERRRRRGSSSGQAASAHFSQSDNPAVLKDRQFIEKVDLSSLRKHRTLTKQQFADAENVLAKKISALAAEIETIQPNMHAAEKYDGVIDKLKECNADLEKAKDVAKSAATRFDELKTLRQKLFNECFQHVSESLSIIYKDLTRSSRHPLGGNAYLTLENTDEPYLGGIRYTAMPPMKRFRDMDQLSGGEKTMAALALLFSIHSYRQAPFFVLDEVDAALDNVNVKKICNYIKHRSKDFQCIVISLKDMFFEHADSLVGICRDVDTLSSCILTLDLKGYDEAEDEGSVGEDEKGEETLEDSPSSPVEEVNRSSGGGRRRGPASAEKATNSLIELGKRKDIAPVSSHAQVTAGGRSRRRSENITIISEQEKGDEI